MALSTSHLDQIIVIPARSSGSPSAGVPRNYLRALKEAGLRTVVVDDAEVGIELLQSGGGVVLPGGADVEPSLYGREQHPATRVEPDLDELELAITRAAIELERPTLAICRGHQVLNVALGGSLVQDLPTERPGGLVHTPTRLEVGGIKDAAHEITIEKGTRLFSMLGERIEVNSAHHQAIDGLGNGLSATAFSDDGTIEAVELEGDGFVVGVQFHPERWTDEVRKPIFTAFAAAVNGERG